MIIAMNSLGRFRINDGKPLMEFCGINLFELGSEGIIPAGAFKDTFEEGSNIKVSAADDDGMRAPRSNVLDRRFGGIQPAPYGELGGSRINKAAQVVRR